MTLACCQRGGEVPATAPAWGLKPATAARLQSLRGGQYPRLLRVPQHEVLAVAGQGELGVHGVAQRCVARTRTRYLLDAGVEARDAPADLGLRGG